MIVLMSGKARNPPIEDGVRRGSTAARCQLLVYVRRTIPGTDRPDGFIVEMCARSTRISYNGLILVRSRDSGRLGQFRQDERTPDIASRLD
jgi:hypothetical protein